MDPSIRKESATKPARDNRWAAFVSRHYKTLAWIGFALWLLTMYAVLFQMGPLFP